MLLIAVWQAAVDLFDIPAFFLPAPLAVAQAFGTYAGVLWRESLYTLATTLVGFGLAVVFGLGLGLLVGGSRTLYAGLYPLMVGFNAIPKVAIVPILVLWFGIGAVPAVITAFLISFFPIVVNVATGLATIEPEMEDVLRALGGSKLDIMRKVGIPRALPYFFGSLKIAITLAFVGSVISESIASNNGIGHLMLAAQAQFRVPLIYACLVVLAVQGILMYAAMAIVERRTTRWAHRSGFTAR
ncbi:MAG: ABC transporter permease [Bauldia sp.]